MTAENKLPEPHRTQLELHQEIEEKTPDLIDAVDLHKAKFDHEKALYEYRSGKGAKDLVDPGVYEKSKGMVAARTESSSIVSPDEAWHEIAGSETWTGWLPVQMHRTAEDVYLRGHPFMVGFVEGTPRIILNKILVRDSGNLDRIYANEWARPWVIAEILDATGFDCKTLVVATIKADQNQYQGQGIRYLKEVARKTVDAFVAEPDAQVLEPRVPTEWNPDWQDGHVRTQLLKYETDWSLLNYVGHGDSIRELIELFQGKRDAKGTPPDRGMTLEQVLF